TPEQSITCLARLEAFKIFGLPLLVGASRKRFISTITPSPPAGRIGGSISAHLLAVHNGAAIFRSHDFAVTVQALRVSAANDAARCPIGYLSVACRFMPTPEACRMRTS